VYTLCIYSDEKETGVLISTLYAEMQSTGSVRCEWARCYNLDKPKPAIYLVQRLSLGSLHQLSRTLKTNKRLCQLALRRQIDAAKETLHPLQNKVF
jgi:hypothetical protein